MDDKQIRLECLKLALETIDGKQSPYPVAEQFYNFVTAQPEEKEPEDDSVLDAASEEILNNLKEAFSGTKVKVFFTGAK